MSSTSPSSAAQAARAALVGRLVVLRKTAGLKAFEVAALCGWHKSKVSRIENARMLPSEADIRAWCRACGAEHQLDELLTASRSVDEMYVDWRRVHQHGIRRVHETTVPLYQRTRLLRVYCSNVVPGLVQTREYATALLSAISEFQGTPNDAGEAADARLRRSRVLYESGHRFVVLVEETVLRYRVGGPQVMDAQLAGLLDVMSLPSLAFGVIPFTADRSMWPVETFMVFDMARVQVETLSAAVNITSPSEIGVYARAFGQLQDLAVFGAKARALVRAARDALE
ncbi:helix-turn-helix domain-containing protein [Streptomyces venezuelae]|uniref:helix-turn-helix domain-containing protein n=1 Tax=Streptomyces venezuelae TaxID=54571 RepID=UPI00332357BE